MTVDPSGQAGDCQGEDGILPPGVNDPGVWGEGSIWRRSQSWVEGKSPSFAPCHLQWPQAAALSELDTGAQGSYSCLGSSLAVTLVDLAGMRRTLWVGGPSVSVWCREALGPGPVNCVTEGLRPLRSPSLPLPLLFLVL